MKGTTVRFENPNLTVLTKVAEALGDLRESLVFIGGCATGLLITTVQAQHLRVTSDVDTIAQVASLADYHAIEEALRLRGFVHDTSEKALICRWVCKGAKLDLMPSKPLFGFHNQWYPLAVQTAQAITLSSGITLRVIIAPAFLATKLEAFKGRGRGDYIASHDLEDIVAVVDGRPELLNEARSSPPELRDYLAKEFRELIAQRPFMDSVSAHLPGDSGSQARLPIVLERFRGLARIAN